MEFKLKNVSFYYRKKLLIIIMRTFIFLCCMTAFSFTPNNGLSQNSKIKITADNHLTIDEVFLLIMHQTDYKFIYQKGIFKDFPKVEVKKGTISANSLLQKSLSKGSFTVEVAKNNMVLVKHAPLNLEIQGVKISGKIVDTNNQPLPGANILEKGTTNGTQTDFDGNFSLTVTDQNSILIVSYLGFITQEITVSNQTNITITMLDDEAALDEVVVIGYGTQRVKDLTGSVKQIKGESFKNDALTAPGLALQGRVAGVRVINSGGRPGSNPTIRIRGATTLTGGGNEPLYVVDGQIVSSGIGFLNQQDIESMTVLKDASASAIYGSRAAAGVVLITTKRGRIGKPVVEFTSTFSIDTATNELDMLNAQEYETINDELFSNAGLTPPGYGVVTTLGDTNWLDQVFRTGSQQNYHLSVRGGNQNNKYAVKAGYYHQEGLVKKSMLDKFTFGVNNDINIGSKIKLSSNIDVTYSKDNQTDDSLVILRALQMPVNVAVEDVDGGLAFSGSTVPHPLADLDRTSPKSDQLIAIGKVSVDYEIIDGLVAKSTFGLEYRNSSRRNFTPTRFFPKDLLGANTSPLATLDTGTNRLFVYNWDNQISYSKSFGDHNFSATAIHTAQESDFVSYNLFASNFLSNEPAFQVIDANVDETSERAGNNRSQWAISSLVGRVTYDYKGKYLLSASVRRDNSSRIHPDFREAVFPSFSAGWVISDESFFNIPAIDRLKFRAGYGEIGNERIGNYPYQSTIRPIGSVFLGGGIQTIVGANRLPNDALEWEATNTTNFGIDLNLFDNKLSLTADYFVKETEGILRTLEVPGYFGISGPISNTSAVENKGFEIAFTYAQDFGDLHVEISPNYTYVSNKITKLNRFEDAVDSALRTSVIGRPNGSIFGYIADGIFQNQGEIDAHATQETGTAPGDVRFRDLNGDGVIDPEDRDFIGVFTPPHDYGININLQYKNIDLTILGVGQSGGQNQWRPDWGYHNFIRPFEINGGIFRNRWRGEGTSNTLPRIVSGDPNRNARASSLFLESTDYFRIQNIQLAYNFPENTIEKLGLSKLRIFTAGQNLITFTDFSGFDPQTGYFTYPVVGSVYFGLNATF